MDREVGDEEMEVPPMLFEIEVETEMSPFEVTGGNDEDHGEMDPSHRPHFPVIPQLQIRLASFNDDGHLFGEWLFEVLDCETFLAVKHLFTGYTQKLNSRKLRRLVAFGRCVFGNIHFLYFLEGLFAVAVSLKHKGLIARIHRRHFQKFRLGMAKM